MIIHRSFWMISVLVGVILLGVSVDVSHAAKQKPFELDRQMMHGQQAAQTPVPVQSEVPDVTETPEERILPPVGGNAGLVLGASVLVLIILGGVMLFSRKKSKH